MRKVPFSISFTKGGIIITLINDEQWTNANFPILVAEEGIKISGSLEQLGKQLSQIDVTDDGIAIWIKDRQFVKQPRPIDVIDKSVDILMKKTEDYQFPFNVYKELFH